MYRIIGIVYYIVWNLVATAANAQDEDQLIRSIYFGGGSWYIDDYQNERLRYTIDSLPNLDQYEIIIHSHTDNIGGKAYNEWLSKMRSEAVFLELIGNAVNPETIHIRDFGLENPTYRNDSYTGRRLNRRVDIIFQPLVF
jgi:outer membrane protein OmpA-like peptidoglycan-associated protein